MKSCSSISTQHCNLSKVDRLQRSGSKQKALYQISDNAINTIATADWLNAEQKQQGKLRLDSIKARQSLTKTELKALLTSSIDGQKWHQSLNDRQWHLVLDLLEQPQTDRYGKRLKEQVWLEANRNPHTPEILATLVKTAKNMAGNEQANILIMTSSARDPFEAVDFYQGVFGENSQWLPIDASVQAARRNADCHKLDHYRLTVQGNLNRSTIYPKLSGAQRTHCLQPQLSLDMISNAQLLFINGGDQSLTWQALRNPDGSTTPELTAIQTRWQQGKLVIAGTSAGSAVQTSQQSLMISNGSNRSALLEGFKNQRPPQRDCKNEPQCHGFSRDSATYQSLGGLGGFAHGIVDTHFSERGRQLRLSQLAQGTGQQQWLIGVDENSAAFVVDDKVTVVGENGVWLAQPNGKQRLITHYLQQNDTANLSDGSVRLAKPQYDERSSAATPPLSQLSSEQDGYRQLAQTLCASTANQALGHLSFDGRHFGVLLHTSTHSQFSQMPSHKWCSYRAIEMQYGEINNE